MENYYEVLGVSKDASQDDIKKMYRSLSMKHHPDRGGNKETFQKINTAYQTLGDQMKKRNYDMRMSGNPLSQLFGGGMNGNQEMGGLFNMFFGGQMPEGMGQPSVKIFRNGVPVNINRQRKPPEMIKTIEITLKQAYTGINFPLEIERWIKEDEIRRTEKEKIYVEIPKGVDNNEIILLSGKGNIINENNKGDIKLHIQVKNTTDFIRDGIDLLLKKTITLKESLLGFNFELEHISGKSYRINNNNGTIIKPNYKKHLEGLGMVRERKGHNGIREIKGSLIILFDVEYPKELTNEQREKLNEIL